MLVRLQPLLLMNDEELKKKIVEAAKDFEWTPPVAEGTFADYTFEAWPEETFPKAYSNIQKVFGRAISEEEFDATVRELKSRLFGLPMDSELNPDGMLQGDRRTV